MDFKKIDLEKLVLPFKCNKYNKIVWSNWKDENFKKHVLVDEIKDTVHRALKNKLFNSLCNIFIQIDINFNDIEPWYKKQYKNLKDYEARILEIILIIKNPENEKSQKLLGWIKEKFWFDWINQTIQTHFDFKENELNKINQLIYDNQTIKAIINNGKNKEN